MCPGIKLAMASLAATLTFGCGGRTIEGVWHGAMPLPDAEDCRMRLYKGGGFDFSCSGGRAWAGRGRHRLRQDVLELNFVVVASQGGGIERRLAPIQAVVSGPGNEITLRFETGQSAVWKRRAP